MNRTGTLLLPLILLAAGCAVPRVKTGSAAPVEVPILLAPNARESGILVRVDSPVPALGPHMGEVQIVVQNRLEEEIFLEVTGFDSLGYDLRDKNGGLAIGGGRFVFFPDNTQYLKRLHASSRRRDGTLFSCGCAMAYIKGKLAEKDLKRWVGSAAKVTVPIVGYLRKNGQHFDKWIDIPIQIVAGERKETPKH